MHFLNAVSMQFLQGQCLPCKRRKSVRPVVPRAAADLVSPQQKGARDQLFTFQGVTAIYLLPFSKVTPGKNCWDSVLPHSGRPKYLLPHAKGRLKWETCASKHVNAQTWKPGCFLKGHFRVVQQAALLQGHQKSWCTVFLNSLKNRKEEKKN